MLTQSPIIEPNSKPRADIDMMLDDFDVHASGFNDQDMSIISKPSSAGTSTTSALVMSAKLGISANSESACNGLPWPDWPDWPDWQDINSPSSLILPELTDTALTGSTLTDHLDVDALNGSPPTTASSSTKVNRRDLIRAELWELSNIHLALELADSLL